MLGKLKQMNIKMILPKKDKRGNSYLSYSQLSLFKRSKQEYFDRYIVGEKFEGNAYTDFGSKVGQGLENNDFSNFTNKESNILKKVRRLDEFERSVFLKYEGFYVLGFIDSNSSDYKEIIDYKTGGKNKEKEYIKDDYNQLQLYALSLRQQTGITPEIASIEFIRREGNAFRGEKLTVSNENPINIPIDVSYGRLKDVYWETLKTAKEIELFYKSNK
jgi:hypothetical protein